MSLAHPFALLFLLVLPVLWLLSRLARRRRVVPVSSLFLWRRLALPAAPPVRLARRSDLLLAIRLCAAGCVALGLAGPRCAAPEPSGAVDVLVDASPSMAAFRDAAEEALGRVRAAVGAGILVREHRSPGTGDLPALLARSRGGSVVVISDHEDPLLPTGGRVRVVLVGHPVENAGIVAASTSVGEDGPRFTAVVRSFATASRRLRVTSPAGEEEFDLAPGEARLFTGPAPGGRAEVRIVPGDAFAFDDRVVVEASPPPRGPLAAEGEIPDSLAAALRAAGMVGGEGRESGGVCWRRAPGPSTAVVVAPPGERRAVVGPVTGGADLAPDALPSPNTPLGAATRLAPGGVVLLADSEGPLAVLEGPRDGRRVTIALDPADPESGLAADPAFPVFFAEVARLLGFRSAGTKVVAGWVDPEESGTVPASRPGDLRALSPSPIDGAKSASASPFLFAAAALLLLGHVLLEARRSARFRT